MENLRTATAAMMRRLCVKRAIVACGCLTGSSDWPLIFKMDIGAQIIWTRHEIDLPY